MQNMDEIVIALTNDAALRVYTAVTSGVVRKAQALHNTFPVATAALGRVLTAGAIMSCMEKETDTKIIIQIKGDGPLGTILTVAEADGKVRGYVANPDTDIPRKASGKLDVGSAVGKNGYLSVIKDFGKGEPYVGQVELVTGEIAEDITYYYAASEQTPTAMALGVLVDKDFTPKAAGGYVIQLMPGFGADDERIVSIIEERMKILPPVSTLVAEGNSAEDITALLLEGIGYGILKSITPEYRCNCSRERVEKALISIGQKDLQSLIDEDIGAETTCSFCDKKYNFSTSELISLLESGKK